MERTLVGLDRVGLAEQSHASIIIEHDLPRCISSVVHGCISTGSMAFGLVASPQDLVLHFRTERVLHVEAFNIQDGNPSLPSREHAGHENSLDDVDRIVFKSSSDKRNKSEPDEEQTHSRFVAK